MNWSTCSVIWRWFTVTCWSAAREKVTVGALADDGTVFGSVYSDAGNVGIFRQAGDSVVVDEDVTADAVAVLGDLLLVSLDEGIACYNYR